LKFTIEDTGLGIKPEDLGKLFKIFGKLDSSKSTNPTGCGLGLVISQNLALRLGPENGKGIFVSSVWGEGSKFAFILQDLNALDRTREEEVELKEGEIGDARSDEH